MKKIAIGVKTAIIFETDDSISIEDIRKEAISVINIPDYKLASVDFEREKYTPGRVDGALTQHSYYEVPMFFNKINAS